jgi:hypothetical protein
MRSRREILATIAAAPAAAQQVNHPHPGHDPEGAGKPRAAKLLNPAEVEALAALADLIIPRTETPGARDAGAHLIIDAVLSESPKQVQAKFREGLRPFLKLDAQGRLAALEKMHKSQDLFFKMLKDLTVDAYYSTREGLQGELGWNGYTPLAEFKGCTHPEHKG